MSSLIVVPWTENSRLEEYNKDPDLFRLMHRGDIKPFHTRQVSVKHCKPFHGNIEAENVVDPIMLTRFLDALGIDNSDEILSEIDPDSRSDSSNPSGPGDDSLPPLAKGNPNNKNPRMPPAPSRNDSSDSSSGFSDPNLGPHPVPAVVIPIVGAPVAAVAPDPGPPLLLNNPDLTPAQVELIHRHAGDPAVANLLDNLDISEDDKFLLRRYYRAQSNMSDVSVRTRSHRRKIDELEQLVRSADPAVRQRAEFELTLALDQLKADRQEFEDSRRILSFHSPDSSIHNDDSIHSALDQSALDPNELPSFGDIQDDVANLLPQHFDIDFDQRPPSPVQPRTPNINIRVPNLSITISHSTPVNEPQGAEFARRPRLNRTPADVNPNARVRDWVSNASPHYGAGEAPWGATGDAAANTPVVTRRGRVVKPVTPYDAAAESLKQKQARDLAKAEKLSKEAVKHKSEAPAGAEKGATAKLPSRAPDPTIPGGASPRLPPAPTAQTFNPFAKSSVLQRSPAGPSGRSGPQSSHPPDPSKGADTGKSTATKDPDKSEKSNWG
jgi:hypothetical protein